MSGDIIIAVFFACTHVLQNLSSPFVGYNACINNLYRFIDYWHIEYRANLLILRRWFPFLSPLATYSLTRPLSPQSQNSEKKKSCQSGRAGGDLGARRACGLCRLCPPERAPTGGKVMRLGAWPGGG